MLTRIMEKFYFLRTTIFIRQLEKRLQQMALISSSIQVRLNQLGDPTKYIPLIRIEEILDSFDKAVVLYFENASAEAIPGISLPSYLKKRQNILYSHSRYRTFLGFYNQTKENYILVHHNLQEIHHNMRTKIDAIASKIQSFHSIIDELKETYIAHSQMQQVINDFKYPLAFYEGIRSEDITDGSFATFKELYKQLPLQRESWNSEFLVRELERQKQFLSDIDGKSLDEQQRIAVLTDEDHNLVLAGAGSGKTLTIAAKVKYLVEQKKVLPHEILLLSFTKKAVAEMKERISEKMNIHVDTKTFHGLGMGILRESKLKSPNVLDPENNHIISDYLNDHIVNDSTILQKMILFFGIYLNIPTDQANFQTKGEYLEQTRSLDYVTLRGKVQELRDQKKTIKGEQVKSQEEVMLANYLYLNGVKYEYERPYAYETTDRYHGQYKPDFYLPDYDVYIEHFGITEENTVPWLNKGEAQKYLHGITWKRDTHEMFKTTLLETYSHENSKGQLLSRLQEKLERIGVQLIPIDVHEVFEAIREQKNGSFYQDFKKLMDTFIGLFKSNGYDADMFPELREKSRRKHQDHLFLREREQLFFDLVEVTYNHYQNELLKNRVIDFNDMINDARVAASSITFPYRYIIIDEYQDISQSRYKLIKTIKESCGARLLCVGDDWQSIYRFAGSDLDLFTGFESYFGHTQVMRIENTYRNSQELIDVAGSFVMQNPRQLRKQLRSQKRLDKPMQFVSYDVDKTMALRHTLIGLQQRLKPRSTVMLLGRNNRDIDWLLQDQNDFRYDKERGIIKFDDAPNLDLHYLTVHKSKGMEADVVVLINAENKTTGFPNKIADDPLLQLVLTNADEMNFAEERRLFYVALTRTRSQLFILSPNRNASIFVQELEQQYAAHIEKDESCLQKKVEVQLACPKCQTGILLERMGTNQKPFLGCSNFPRCDVTRDISIKDEQVMCQKCEGYMVKRTKNGSDFYGCTNFPRCSNTRSLVNK